MRSDAKNNYQRIKKISSEIPAVQKQLAIRVEELNILKRSRQIPDTADERERVRMAELQAAISDLTSKMENKLGIEAAAGRELSSAIRIYRKALAQSRKLLNDMRRNAGEIKTGDDEELKIKKAELIISDAERDFIKHELRVKKRADAVVTDVVVNGAVKAEFKVDASRPDVVISDAIKEKLSLPVYGTTLSLNDIHERDRLNFSEKVLIDSLRFGTCVMKNVGGSSRKFDGPGYGGVLGFGNFYSILFETSSDSGKLILYEFKPA